jgi:hypothetical protein
MHAALSLLIALVVKLKISRSEAEMAAGGAGGVRRGGVTGVPRVRPPTGKVGCHADWLLSAAKTSLNPKP